MKTIPIFNSSVQFPIAKIFCVGKNYLEHAKEMGRKIPSSPVIFLKPATALHHGTAPIQIPSVSKIVHHEVELVIAIGRGGKNIPEPNAADYIFGYAVGLDMTLRDIQSEAKKEGLPWTLAKGFDTSAPVSQIIPKLNAPTSDFEICCRVNGQEKQRTFTSQMIFSPAQLISYISFFFTIEEGDLIFTGTPAGVSAVQHNDVVEAELVGYTAICHQVLFQ